jgi:hypothetical protein
MWPIAGSIAPRQLRSDGGIHRISSVFRLKKEQSFGEEDFAIGVWMEELSIDRSRDRIL